MAQKMPHMGVVVGPGGQPSVLDERACHERKSARAVLGRYSVTSLARSGKYNTHIVVDEDEVVLVAPHLVHDVVATDVAM